MHIEMDEESQPIELTAERREMQRSFPRNRVWVAAVALAAFGVFTWYAYHQATKAGEQGVAPLIKAEEGPSRVKPEDQGGAEAPQDKTVYERMASDQPAPPKAESLLPPPEQPMAHPQPGQQAASSVETKAVAAIAPAAGPSAAPTSSAEVAKSEAPPPPPAMKSEPAAAPPPAPPAAKSAETTASPDTNAKMAEATPKTGEATTAASGSYRVQLAALRSQDAADGEWKKLQKAHPDLLGSLTVNVVKVDLADKGTFYRVQAGALSESAAKELCAELKRRKAECIVVKS